MVHKGDMKIIAQMLKNIEKESGTVKFKAPLVIAPPTYNIIDELKKEANKLIKDAEILQNKGCFSIVLEKVPSTLAKKVTKSINIPTIGIGAGKFVDGQVLVTPDMLGMTQDFNPRFIRRYANLNKDISKACSNYIKDVKSGNFPNENESY